MYVEYSLFNMLAGWLLAYGMIHTMDSVFAALPNPPVHITAPV